MICGGVDLLKIGMVPKVEKCSSLVWLYSAKRVVGDNENHVD